MTRVWTGRQGAAAIVVLIVTAVWRGPLLKASYFNQDDYYLTGRAYRSGLSWDFLFEDAAGHVQPAQQLAYWLVAHHAPFDWGRIAAVILVAELLAAAVMWHLLSRLLPGSWARVPLFAVFAWSPITLVPTLWWSAAMGLWGPMIFLLLAVLFFVRAQQHAGRVGVNLVLCVLAVLVGLTWHERGILAVAVLAGVAVARSDRTGWRRLPDAARQWWFLWLPLIVLSIGYLLLHQALTDVDSQQSTIGSRADIVTAFVFRNTVPGLASGPWQADVLGGAIVPKGWVVVVTGVLAALVATAIVRWGGPARWTALVMLAAYVAGDVLLLVLGRAGFGEIIGLDPRYTADVVAAAVLFVALALEGAPRLSLRFATVEAVAVGAALVYSVGSVVTTAQLAPEFDNQEDRQFITRVRSELARDADQVLFDRLSPPGILLPLLGDEALLSAVLEPLPERPVFDAPSPKLRAVADDGRLVEVRIVPVASSVPGPDGACGHAVKAGATVIDMESEAPLTGRSVVRVEAFTDREADYEVRIGTWSDTIHVVPGPQELWMVVPGQSAGLTSMSVTGTGRGTLCVVGVVAGPPVEEP